ncbi:MAG: DUF2273 domain-containing protein [Ruminiclostridium sp.]|nr:DUF2273 domain-containing protein [Ruminiclostridium sp.]
MDLEKILEVFTAHRGGIIGAVTGLLIAVAILLLGFFKVLFIAILAGVGYYIGKRIHEDRDYIKNMLDRVLPPGTYR